MDMRHQGTLRRVALVVLAACLGGCVYAPPYASYDPYYSGYYPAYIGPPVTVDLGFGFYSHHHHGGRGYYGGRHGWGHGGRRR